MTEDFNHHLSRLKRFCDRDDRYSFEVRYQKPEWWDVEIYDSIACWSAKARGADSIGRAVTIALASAAREEERKP